MIRHLYLHVEFTLSSYKDNILVGIQTIFLCLITHLANDVLCLSYDFYYCICKLHDVVDLNHL